MLLTIGCGNGDAPSCSLGSPEPIFQPDMTGIESHQFSGDDQNSTEQVQFTNGTTLLVHQSGCDQLTQLFQFTIPADTTSLRSQTVQSFRMVGGQNPDLAVFGLFANAMEEVLPTPVVRNQPYELQPGMNVTLDEVTGGSERILRVRFTN